ncbi:GNAT family N-acetyltransferase [Pseudogracilibacillus auburnensis]|uniref:GNAT family acetyltransferase n=1 Tax=Pseudogracilibacillus auburnensis TaxID=1494959 RepID=A0A2V3WB16_9BACI|nr:GNAT family N-acetyltransferase [Pseudogracilibacillus auburnensis]MBO1001977.1 GNAT family N-acetyltransferase [Pseudogracilibacillus auburnensis]PXW90201.1 GNAT family acetyltransferase [Pseudogracilibacillus auburnensis]
MKIIPWQENRINDVVELWNKEIGADFPLRVELCKQNSFEDSNICLKSSCIALNGQDEIIGFVIAKRWQENINVNMDDTRGWIQALLVAKPYRQQGIGSTLLEHAESQLKDIGVKQILLGKDTYHYFPGIPKQYEDVAEWFETKGYENFGTEYDLIRHYDLEDGMSVPKMAEVEFTTLSINDKEEFLTFLNRCFPGRWEYEAIHYFQKGGTGREFVVLKKGRRIIGFCRINDAKSPLIAQNVYWAPLVDEELGGVGPLGVDAKERGQGYGLAIVEAGIAFLRQRGIERIVIDWTGLVDFYKRLGYDIWKGYLSYKKEL